MNTMRTKTAKQKKNVINEEKKLKRRCNSIEDNKYCKGEQGSVRLYLYKGGINCE